VSAALPLLQTLTQSATGLHGGGYLLVQDGEGFTSTPETLELRTGASARVVRVDSELGLRHALWKHAPAPVIALVPESLSLPADLLLGAERRRVHTLTGDEVLTALLGTRVTGVDDAELRKLAIDHAEAIQNLLNARTTPTVIDRGLLERTLVEVVAELQDLRAADGHLSELLTRWILAPPAWTPVLQRLASSTLSQHHGDAGRVLAWALEDPTTRPQALLVHGALLSVEGDVAQSAWGPVWALRDPKTSPLRAPAVARAFVVELASETARSLEHAALPLLQHADTLARTLLPGRQLQSSPLLPLAFEERAHGVAARLGSGQPVDRDDLRALRSHAYATTESRRLDLLDDMARLVRYLRHPRDDSADAAAIALAYLQDHAHADRCARRVERALASTPAHQADARALLDQIQAARDALNHTYADLLARSYQATLFSHDLVALQNLTRDVVAERRTEPDCERVFLLVLDGCSVPVFLDLLDQLAAPAFKVGLEGGSGLSLRLGAGLSPLPTITSHARGALFLGAIPKDPFVAETVWREDGERLTDPARFKQNPTLQGASRALFLKGDLADGGLALRTALQADKEVVAAVFNAVDDRIGSHDTGAAWRMQVEDITGLLPALNAALGSGRKVLLTADHGHSPFRSKDLRVGPGATPRYARLGDDEPVPEGFIEVDCGDLAGEPGRTAFAWCSGVYRGQIQVGFHGGCSLEEMVVPVAWLTRNGQPADRPGWWRDAGGPDVRGPEVQRPGAGEPEPPEPEVRDPAPGAPPPELPFDSPPPVALGRLPQVLREHLDPSQQEVVAWLIVEGKMRTSILARRLGKPAFRTPGFLNKLNRSLTAHGARLVSEELPDLELQWRYEGPEEGE